MWIATGLQVPSDVAVDSVNAYFTDSMAGTVSSVPVAGGRVVTLATMQQQPMRVALDSTYVYWTNGAGTSSVMRVRKDGTAMPEQFAGGEAGRAIAVVPGGTPGCSRAPFYCAPASDNGSLVVWTPLTSMVYDGLTLISTELATASYTSIDPSTWTITQIQPTLSLVTPNEPSGSAFNSMRFYVVEGHQFHSAVAHDKATAGIDSTPLLDGFTDTGPFSNQVQVLDDDGVGSGCATFYSQISATNSRTLQLHLSLGSQTVTLANTSAGRVAIDGANVYFTDASGAIGRLPMP
jgi:hypothetical protein